MPEVSTVERQVAGGSRRRRWRRVRTVVMPFVGLAVGVGAWWLGVIVLGVDPFILPPPNDVAGAFAREPVLLLEESWTTLLETLAGFLIATIIGLVIGTVVAGSRVMEETLSPILVAFNAIPKIALGPLFIVWFGFDLQPKIVMVVVLCFFPIVLAVAAGLKSTPAELTELARSLDASMWQTFVKVRFPAALAQIFVGLKVAMPLAVIGAVVGEFLGGSAGLGFVITGFGAVGDIAMSFAAVAMLAVLSLGLYYAIVGIERLIVPWARPVV